MRGTHRGQGVAGVELELGSEQGQDLEHSAQFVGVEGLGAALPGKLLPPSHTTPRHAQRGNKKRER